MLRRVEVDIEPTEDAGALLDRLAELGGDVLADSLRDLVGGATPTPQPTAGATLAPKITGDDTRLDWTAPAQQVVDLVRSASPAPGTHTTLEGRRFKVYAAQVVDGPPGGPGELVALDDGPVVACGQGHVRLTVVQPEGKPRMDATAWANGHRPEVGTRLGA